MRPELDEWLTLNKRLRWRHQKCIELRDNGAEILKRVRELFAFHKGLLSEVCIQISDNVRRNATLPNLNVILSVRGRPKAATGLKSGA